MHKPFVHRVGGVLSADIAVPDHDRELDFYSRVLTTGDEPLWREDLMNNLGMPVIGLGVRTPEYSELPQQWMPHFQVADVAASAASAIELGGKTVEMHHIAPGDGVGTTVIYMPQEQVVMTADLYSPHALTNGAFMNDQNLLGMRSILNEVATWELQHAITSHAPSTDPQYLRDAAAYYDDLFVAIDKEMASVMAEQGFFAAFGLAEQLTTELKLPQYAEWEGYDDFLPAHIRRMALSIIHGG